MTKTTTIWRRRLIRQKVLQALYAHELSKEPIELVMEQIFHDFKSSSEEFEFAKKLIHEVIQHRNELEDLIKKKVAHWELGRIAILDRLLLSMGICELLYFPDIPPKVTINEAIAVAKTFSTEQSGRFINGVLDGILVELKTNKTLRKTGRGLIDQNFGNEINTSGQTKSTEGK